MRFPEMAVFYQQLISAPVADAAEQTCTAIKGLPGQALEIEGKSIAVAVGSRKIDRLDWVVSAVVGFIKARGGMPFIVPAMGSHGGATADGQKHVLETLGITESRVGAPIRAEMAARLMGQTPDHVPLYVPESALAADAIVPINRIKPHTKFCADIESGLCKMLTIGLGKDAGAAAFHRAAVSRSFALIESAAAQMLKLLNVPFGIALVEDGRGQLSKIRVLLPAELIAAERELLQEAYAMMGRIPWDHLDLLVVDRIGKGISGIGMDSNVTGRHRDITGDFAKPPNPKRIFVRDISADSDGNANGIGLADVTTARLVSKIDRDKTALNAVTAISPEKAAIPLHFDTDRQCLSVCLRTAGLESGEHARVVRIRDTASLEYIQASRCLETEINPGAAIGRVTSWQPWAFDASGNLQPFYPEH